VAVSRRMLLWIFAGETVVTAVIVALTVTEVAWMQRWHVLLTGTTEMVLKERQVL